jgi:hypothetical protein
MSSSRKERDQFYKDCKQQLFFLQAKKNEMCTINPTEGYLWRGAAGTPIKFNYQHSASQCQEAAEELLKTIEECIIKLK